MAAFVAGYVGLSLGVVLVRSIGLRLALALLALAPILWGSWILFAARIPPRGITMESLRALRAVGERRRDVALRSIVEEMMTELRRMASMAERVEGNDGSGEARRELDRIETRLIELVRRAREAAIRAPVREPGARTEQEGKA